MSYSFKKNHVLAVFAFLILAIYILGATRILVLPRLMYVFPFMALGPLGVVASVELGHFLARKGSSVATRVGTAFGVVAFALWEVVVTVQNGTRELWREFIVPDLQTMLEGGTEAVQLIYRGVNAIQATVDVGFDIFYCLAILLFSALMWKDERFGRLIGGFGILSSCGLLIINLWTFPRPPAEAGLFDLGPVTGLWWIVVIIAWVRADSATRDA